ncbi:hypothetical protein ACIOFV_07320 [Streptomyces mirabilis]|uniref:hypothetical protein n=1 Tax=Streptomyces mirabilis TaxID=68239 RepID=UPI003821F305
MSTSFKRLAGVLALTLAALLAPIAPASAAPAPDPVPGSVLNLGPGGLVQTMLLTFNITFEKCGDLDPFEPGTPAGAAVSETCPLGTPLT